MSRKSTSLAALAVTAALGAASISALPTQANAGATPSEHSVATAELFDDFLYANSDDPKIAARNWTVRTGGGGPGVPGATWSRADVTFPTVNGAKVMQMFSSTNGTAAGTKQTEFYHKQKFFEGTYAARVRFSDTPTSGPDGDQLVQTFFTITPLAFDLDPNYGEIDFEYLPNGGWGLNRSTLFMTTWETYQGDPWIADNVSNSISRRLDGWHNLVFQVSDGHVKYYLDGRLVADHSGKYYPETPMFIDFNNWFISGGLVASSTPRGYIEQVDWVYHTKNEVVSPRNVLGRVDAFRTSGVDWKDTVPG